MDAAEWFGAAWGALWFVVLSTTGMFVTVIVCTRLAGLRSLSKMSSFDFATTVAFGSLLATVSASRSVPLAQGVTALATLFALQVLVAVARRRAALQRLVDNKPMLLMHRGAFLDEHLLATRVTRDDVRARLRAAGVVRLDDVRAVVLETTGDVSVLQAGDPDTVLDAALLSDVVGRDRLP